MCTELYYLIGEVKIESMIRGAGVLRKVLFDTNGKGGADVQMSRSVPNGVI